MIDTPAITVTDTPKLDAALVIVRYVMFALGNILIAKGWFSDDQWIMVSGGIMTAIPPIYGAINAFTKKKTTVAIANGASATVV